MGEAPEDGTIFLYTTWPDAETARTAGRAAIEQGLAACANLFAPISAIYRWEGAVEEAPEAPMTFKTTASRATALRAFIIARHPYELPCVLALRVDAAASSPQFLDWIAGETAKPPSGDG